VVFGASLGDVVGFEVGMVMLALDSVGDVLLAMIGDDIECC
jgi:hypothetical protein